MKKETDAIDLQIKALDEYREEWSKVSSSVQEAIEDQRAAEILGADWRDTILSRNLDALRKFTEEYKQLHQEQADAALKAAEAEAKAKDPAGGKTTKDRRTKTDPDEKEPEYAFKDINGKEHKGYKSEQEAQEAADKQFHKDKAGLETAYTNSHGNDKSVWQKLNKLKSAKKYDVYSLYDGTDSAKSGTALVGELGSEIILNKNGTASIVTEPTIVKMQGGEKVFNAEETSRILNGSKYSPLSSYDPKKFKMLNAFANGTSSAMQNAIATQAVSIASGISKGYSPYSTTNNGGATVNNTFNVSLPNITDASKATDLIREFEALTMKGMQYFNS